MFGAIGTAKTIAGGIAALALLGILWWVISNLQQNAERGRILDATETIITDATGLTAVRERDIPAQVQNIVDDRDQQRDNVQTLEWAIERQGETIRDLGDETERLRALSNEQRRLARIAIQERDAALRRFREASTRLEQRAAEEELLECQGVVDGLFEMGF